MKYRELSVREGDPESVEGGRKGSYEITDYEFEEDCWVLSTFIKDNGESVIETDERGVDYAYIDRNRTKKILLKAPEDLEGEYVVDESTVIIAADAFLDCEELTKVVLPDGLQVIGDYAFFCCFGLEPPALPPGVEYIGADSLPEEYGIFIVPKSLRQYKQGCIPHAKEYRSESTEFKISGDFLVYRGVLLLYLGRNVPCAAVPNGVSVIGKEAFKGHDELKDISIPPGVTAIEDGAFADCAALERCNIPNTVEKIGADAFKKCVSLREICLPDSVKEFKWGVFEGCRNLETVKLPSAIDSIPARTFENCVALTQITIPESVKHIDYNAFAGSGLQSLYIPEGVFMICGDAFADCKNLQSVRIPKVFFVDKTAFGGCENLQSVKIPKGFCVDKTSFEGCPNVIFEEYEKPEPPPPQEETIAGKQCSLWNRLLQMLHKII